MFYCRRKNSILEHKTPIFTFKNACFPKENEVKNPIFSGLRPGPDVEKQGEFLLEISLISKKIRLRWAFINELIIRLFFRECLDY